jgi:hypothetical protein
MTTNMILQTATETADVSTADVAFGLFLGVLAMALLAKWYYTDAPAPMIECWDCGQLVDTNAYCGACGAELDYGRVEEYDGDGDGDPLRERLGRLRDGLPTLPSLRSSEETEETEEEEADSAGVEVAPKHLHGDREEADA